MLPHGISSKPKIVGQQGSGGAPAKCDEGGGNWENLKNHARSVFQQSGGPSLKAAMVETIMTTLQSLVFHAGPGMIPGI